MQAIVQPRGEVNVVQDVHDMLTMLSIHHMNHATFVSKTDVCRGMISKVNGFAAHGKPSVDVVETFISTRAESEKSDDDITDERVSESTDYDDVAAPAQAIVDEETTPREQGVSPVTRLRPPCGGHRGQKHVTKEGDQLSKHSTEQIDGLLEDMR